MPLAFRHHGLLLSLLWPSRRLSKGKLDRCGEDEHEDNALLDDPDFGVRKRFTIKLNIALGAMRATSLLSSAAASTDRPRSPLSTPSSLRTKGLYW